MDGQVNIRLILLALFMSSCATQGAFKEWETLNGVRPDEPLLIAALEKCDAEVKSRQVKLLINSAINLYKSQRRSGEANEFQYYYVVHNDPRYKKAEKIIEEINACMNSEGFATKMFDKYSEPVRVF